MPTTDTGCGRGNGQSLDNIGKWAVSRCRLWRRSCLRCTEWERQRRTGGGNVWKSANVFGSSAGGVDCFSFFRKFFFFFLSFLTWTEKERKKKKKDEKRKRSSDRKVQKKESLVCCARESRAIDPRSHALTVDGGDAGQGTGLHATMREPPPPPWSSSLGHCLLLSQPLVPCQSSLLSRWQRRNNRRTHTHREL